jgi:hypothetical protein
MLGPQYDAIKLASLFSAPAALESGGRLYVFDFFSASCPETPPTPRSALPTLTKSNGGPRQGFASPATAVLDPPGCLPQDVLHKGEALYRIALTRGSLLSLWSDFQARYSTTFRIAWLALA